MASDLKEADFDVGCELRSEAASRCGNILYLFMGSSPVELQRYSS